MSQAKIEEALRTAFLAALPAAVNNTAFENQLFNPEGRAKWFVFNCLPNVPEVATLGSAGQDSFDGIAQIDINIGLGQGKQGIEADVEALRKAFRAGNRLIRDNVSVTIKSCGRNGSGRKADAFYRYTLTISWESRITRGYVLDLTGTSFDVDAGGNLLVTYGEPLEGASFALSGDDLFFLYNYPNVPPKLEINNNGELILTT